MGYVANFNQVCEDMSEREAIQILQANVVYACEKAGVARATLRMVADALDLAISALKKQGVDRWIPVTESLPEEKDAGILKKLGTNKRSDYVLATVEVEGERMTVMACTYDGEWYWNMNYAFPDYKIIAWKPRPEPYEEKKYE